MDGWQDAMAWFGGTGFVDLVIVITLVEAAGLWAWSRWRGGIDFDALMPSLASGLMLMVALRADVGGAAWPWVVLPVALAGVCHLWDLQRRWSHSHGAARAGARVDVSSSAAQQVAPLSPP